MQTRQWWIGVAVLALGAAGFFFWSAMPRAQQANFAAMEFSYPGSYVLQQHVEEAEGREWHVALLTKVDNLPPPENSEGPPSIILIAFDNEEGRSAEEWVRNSTSSNFQLEGSGLARTTIGGEEGVSYRYSGLYENDAAAVAHAGKIYFFSAGWVAEDDAIRQEFRDLLASVTFVR